MLRKALVVALAAGLVPACGEEAGEDQLSRMAEEHEGDRPVAAAAADSGGQGAVESREVGYGEADGRELTGYFAAPEDAADSLPGLLVIHEWWGLNDNIRTMTRRLASLGYAALAVDLYGDAVATSPDSASTLARSVQEAAARANLRQAYNWLVDRGAPRVGSVGWCFGGGWSLQTALMLPEELDAAVIYYGRLVTDPEQLATLELPMLGHFGAEDGSIPVEEVRRFERSLEKAGVPHRIYVYEGAGHAFANPSGERYVEAAADTAWRRTTGFLTEHLAAGGGTR